MSTPENALGGVAAVSAIAAGTLIGGPVGGLGAAAVVGVTGSVLAQTAGERSGKQALDLEAQQNQLEYAQKSNDAEVRLNQYLDKAEINSTVRGVAPGSPSLGAQAIQAQNQTAREQQNLKTESDIKQRNIDVERKNLKNKLYGDLFGDVTTGVTIGSDLLS